MVPQSEQGRKRKGKEALLHYYRPGIELAIDLLLSCIKILSPEYYFIFHKS